MLKRDLVDQLAQIRQSEKEMGGTRKERVYHAAFDTFVRLIMGKCFMVDLYVCMYVILASLSVVAVTLR